MRKLTFLFLISLFFSNNVSAEVAVEVFMKNVCEIADKQIRDEYLSQYPKFQDIKKLDRELIIYERKIKNSVDSLLVSNADGDPPTEKLKNLFRIFKAFSNNPESDIEKLFRQYSSGADVQGDIFKGLLPDLTVGTQPNIFNGIQGDLDIIFTPDVVILEQQFKVDITDLRQSADIQYKLSIVYDRDSGSFHTDVRLVNVTFVDYKSFPATGWQTLRESEKLIDLSKSLSYGSELGENDILDLKSNVSNINEDILNTLKSKHHAQCFAILYGAPTLDQQMQKIALNFLGRGTQTEDKAQVVNGLGSEAHGEGQKQVTKSVN